MKKFYVLFRKNHRKVLGMTVECENPTVAAFMAEMKAATTLSNLEFDDVFVKTLESVD